MTARAEGDEVTERKYEAYYKADTIMMNALWNGGAFILNELNEVIGIDYEKAFTAIEQLVKELETAHAGNIEETVPQLHQTYGNEGVWDNFFLSE